MTDDLSQLEGTILQAALDPSAWCKVMAEFVVALPAVKASLLGFDTRMQRNVPTTLAGFHDAFVDTYGRHFHALNPFAPSWPRIPVGRVVHSTEFVLESDLLRTEFYQDWLRPQKDIRHVTGAVLARDPGRLFLLSLHIEHRAADRLTRPAMAAVARLQGLMRHALDVNRTMLGLRLDAEALRHGVEPSDAGVLLLCQEGVILHANRRAERMLEEGRVLGCDGAGRLRMAREVRRAPWEDVLRPRPGRAPFVAAGPAGVELRVVPLRPDSLQDLRMPLLLDRSPAALVLVQPSRPGQDGTAQVMRALGLTRAEAEVAQALAAGATVAEVAELRRVSIQTIRNQVKSALGKTGSRRQADLVREVTCLRRP